MPPQGRRCRLPFCCAPPLELPEEADTTYRSSGGGYARCRRGGGRGLLAEVHQEQRLVDAALEDRHAHLHALLDHLTALQTGSVGVRWIAIAAVLLWSLRSVLQGTGWSRRSQRQSLNTG